MCPVSDGAVHIPPNLIFPSLTSERCSQSAGEMESVKGNDFSRITQQPDLDLNKESLLFLSYRETFLDWCFFRLSKAIASGLDLR